MEGNVSKADQAAKTELSPLSAASGNSHTRRECIIEAADSRVQEADGRWQMADGRWQKHLSGCFHCLLLGYMYIHVLCSLGSRVLYLCQYRGEVGKLRSRLDAGYIPPNTCAQCGASGMYGSSRRFQ